jgi:hypothetical protein
MAGRYITLYASHDEAKACIYLTIGCNRGWWWLFLWLLCFFGFTLLSFSHDNSPCNVNMLKYAATNNALLSLGHYRKR